MSCQTRLSSSRVSALLTRIKTMTRKVRQLSQRCSSLAAENRALKEKASVRGVMKKLNIIALQSLLEENDSKAKFLAEQLQALPCPKHRWSEETVRLAIQWHASSPCTYELIRECRSMSLPSRRTLHNYIGRCTGEAVSSAMKQRLEQEAAYHSGQALHGSVVVDEMSLKQELVYQQHGDVMDGFVDFGGLERHYKEDGCLATHLLCFLFVGLSVHYRLPVAYYFTRALTGEQLHRLTLEVKKSIEGSV